jgi:hypothetical protein
MFIDGKINFQNIFKKLRKIACRRRIRRRQKRCTQSVKIFLILLFHIQNFNQLLSKFFFPILRHINGQL